MRNCKLDPNRIGRDQQRIGRCRHLEYPVKEFFAFTAAIFGDFQLYWAML
jgi:hypothetical protein